jgi:hypothetical protein
MRHAWRGEAPDAARPRVVAMARALDMRASNGVGGIPWAPRHRRIAILQRPVIRRQSGSSPAAADSRHAARARGYAGNGRMLDSIHVFILA